jgi:hypothetical protein
MALKPQELIGMEVHKLDPFFRVEEGTGEIVRDGVHTKISAGSAVLVPAGVTHCGPVAGRMLARRAARKARRKRRFLGVFAVLYTTAKTTF